MRSQGPGAPPHIGVVELNPHWPRPFVFSEIALCLRDQFLAAGYEAEHLVNEIDPTRRLRAGARGLDGGRRRRR
jgi:hypothetical protein